jgi:diphthine-ammonia ligase
MTLEDEVRECFHILQSRGTDQRREPRLANFGPQGHLSEHSLSFSHIANINVFISSMEDFASINAVYATYFGVSPPARACVAVDLPRPLRVMLDCVIYAEQKADDRKALHVQGLSYWSPANIGPYSQAIQVDEHTFVSGQIGLVPSSLSVPLPRSLATEIPLVSQHSDRIVKALSSSAGGGCGWDGHAQMILYWVAEERHISYSIMAAQRLDVSRPSIGFPVPKRKKQVKL